MDNKNLELWERVSETNPFYTKEVGYGSFKFTSINAQYQLHQATKEFGRYGEGWGIKDIDYEFQDLPDGGLMALAKATFFAGNSRFPISSSIMVAVEKNGKYKNDDEWAKKIETDITTKALSKLGFNADVFLGRYDDNRYVNDMKKKFEEVPKKFLTKDLVVEMVGKLADADKAKVKAAEDWVANYADNEHKQSIIKVIEERKKNL